MDVATAGVPVARKKIYEITAQNVTRRIRMIDGIHEDNKRLLLVKERLKQYNKNVLELAASRELLERKEHTHDELGKLLSATRHYLDGGDVDAGELWNRWHINAALMLQEACLPTEKNLLESLQKTAETIGVKLTLCGEVPQDSGVSEVLLAAGGESMTNLLRHTKSNELYIQLKQEKDVAWISISNGGKPPEGEITEGGGLSALRRKVEAMGGMMEVHSQPAYRLTLAVPMKK